MRVLAIDTTLGACAAAVLDTATDRFLSRETLEMTRGHAEALMPLLARVMDASGLEFADLDRIAVTVGPGSFTGLRVGIAAARGIALACGKPVVGISTLSALAVPHVTQETAATVASAIDARHEQVYLQVFGSGGRTLVTPRLAPIRDAIRALHTDPIIIAGSGAALIASIWPAGSPRPQIDNANAPDIGSVARLGAAAQESDAPPKPLYLRRPDAKPQDSARLPHQ